MIINNDTPRANEDQDIDGARRDLLKLTGIGAVALGAVSPMMFASAASAQSTAQNAEGIKIIRLGAEPTAFGPSERFTGRVVRPYWMNAGKLWPAREDVKWEKL